jgi:ketosteroid isomerase-like protein
MKSVFLSMMTAVLLFSACKQACDKACCATEFDLEKVKTAIAESNKSYGTTFATGDSAGFVSHYTTDACILLPNAPKMCGAAMLNAFFNEGYKMGIRNIALTTDEVSGCPAEVIETGTYELFADSSKSLDKGKYIIVWKAEDGQWKMHRDIWNSDAPMPGH